MTSPENDDRVCENCGRWVEPNEILYRVHIEVFADPGPLDLSLDKSREEVAAEMDALLRQLEAMDDTAVSEATDQVYEDYRFILCPACRKEMHRRILQRRDIL